jgi:NADH-quinone oxidoreductase subunit E
VHLSCQLNGDETVGGFISRKLGVSNSETAADGKIILDFVECIGACDFAPAMLINGALCKNTLTEEVDSLREQLTR